MAADINRIRREIRTEVLDYQQLVHCLEDYANPRAKIGAMLKAGDIVRVKKGLYVFGKDFRRRPWSREILANLIYGPSCVARVRG